MAASREDATFGAVVYVKDLDRAVEFYSRVAGLPVAHRGERFALLRSGPVELTLHRIPEHIAAAIHIDSPPQRREDTAVKLVFAVPRIDVARADAAVLGGTVDPVGHEWRFDGVTVCDGHDPEGNVIQLRQRAA